MIFVQGQDVPEYILRPAPGVVMEYFIFGVTVEAECIDGIWHVWPFANIGPDDNVIEGKIRSNSRSDPVMVDGTVKVYFVPKEYDPPGPRPILIRPMEH